MSRKHFAMVVAVIGLLATSPLAVAQQQHGSQGHGGHGTPAGGGHVSRPSSLMRASPAAGIPQMHAPAGGFSRGGHFASPGGTWSAHPVWRGRGEFQQWRGGHWWHGTHGGRTGAWWIVGPDWYWYPTEVGPMPDPYTPPGMTPGYWYWCDFYQQYYPFVGACPSGWQAVAPQ